VRSDFADQCGGAATNREIAERLTVSARTVEGHVYRASMKLDGSERDELARLIRKERSA